MTRQSAKELREETRQRELFFAHIAAQAEAARRETARRHIIMAILAIVALICLGIVTR